jgi:putative FmdB family regulatory protein
MPIYAYRCASCGHDKDVIQKFSDAPLTLCPVCGADAFRKQLTAPSFQLKGSGWYVTDFRDQGKSKGGKADGGKSEGEGATTTSAPSSTEGGGASAPAAPAASTPSSSGSSDSASAPAATPAKPAST